MGQRFPRHQRRGRAVRPGGARGGPADGRVRGPAAGRPVPGGPAATAGGPAADRRVRAGRDDGIPAAAQQRRAGGTRGHRQPARRDRPGLRQPAGGGLPGRASDAQAVGGRRGRAGRHRRHRGRPRAELRRLGADRAGRGGPAGDLPHRAETPAQAVHQLRGHGLRHVGGDGVRAALGGFGGARPAAGRRVGHRRGRLPRGRAVGGRLRAVGLRHGADGRRPGHPQPVPGPGGRDPDLAGLARPATRPGRAGRRGGRARRRRPGQQQGPAAGTADARRRAGGGGFTRRDG